jgi:hypothetical protein
MRRTIIAFSLLTLASASIATSACSEATDGVVPDAAVEPGEGGATGDGAAAPTDGGGAKADAGPPLTAGDSSVLINEISASDEWIELVGSGTSAVDVSGFRLADSKDGGPKLDEAVTLPPGTILSPKAYLIVQGGGLDGGGKACPDGGQSYCFNAEFGISNKNGETLFLIDSADAVVGTVVYPPQGAASGESWSRLPSAEPGASNQAK